MTKALEVTDIQFSYTAKQQVLSDVSFAIEQGKFTVLMGVNGAGKSTLISLISRLTTTRSGNINIMGHSLSKKPLAALAELGIVFQQQTLEMQMTVMQNLLYFASLRGMSSGQARPLIKNWLAEFQLTSLANHTIGKLSGGQRRRAELVRALLHRPSLLIMDEATAGLDIESRHDFLKKIRELMVDQSMSILWATHLSDEIQPDDEVIILDKGRVLANAPASALLAQTGKENMESAFLSLINREVQP